MKKIISIIVVTALALIVSSQANATCHVELKIENKTPYDMYLSKVSWGVAKGDWLTKSRTHGKELSHKLAKNKSYTYKTSVGVKKCDSKGRKHFVEVTYKCRTNSTAAPSYTAKRKFKDGGKHADATVEFKGQFCDDISWSNS